MRPFIGRSFAEKLVYDALSLPSHEPHPVMLHVIAVLAHESWCQQRRGQADHANDRADATGPGHDALASFASLSPVDRRDLLLLVGDHFARLVSEIEYQHGDDREFIASEMRAGLPVGWSHRIQSEDPAEDLEAAIGHVTTWEALPPPDQQLLRVIRVQWVGGGVSEHLPCERELRRLS